MKWLSMMLVAVLLAGCWDVTEPERMYYVHGVGVDYVDGKYEIYVQVIDFANVAKTEQPNPDAKQMEVGKATGKTINEAFLNLYHTLDMRLFWGHFSYVLLTEAALADGRANTVFNSFSRYRETRYQVWVYGTKEKPEDILLATPVLNKSITLSKLANPLNSFEQQSEIIPRNFRQTIIHLQEPNYVVAIPYITITEHWSNDEEQLKVIEMEQIAFLKNDGLLFTTKSENVNGLQWLSNETKRGEVTFSVNGEAVTTTIERLSVQVTPVKEQFDVLVKVDANISAFNAEVSMEQVKQKIKETIAGQIRDTYAVGYEQQVDVFRLSHMLYQKDIELFKEIEQDGQIPLKEDTLRQVEVVVEKLSGARKEFTETVTK